MRWRFVPLWQRWRSRGAALWQRWSLWVLLVGLVLGMLVILVYLAGRYEASQVQDRIERDAADIAADVRGNWVRNQHALQTLPQSLAPSYTEALPWHSSARQLLQKHPELLRIERRDMRLQLRVAAESPFQVGSIDGSRQNEMPAATALACNQVRRTHAPSYSSSYFQMLDSGLGYELLDICLPLVSDGQIQGFVIASYQLREVLQQWVAPRLARTQEVSFTETDGARLALLAAQRRGSKLFTAQHLLDLPGYTMVLRLDGWHTAPDVFPNVLTALVTLMSIALVSVVFVLVRDNRRRLAAERDLGEALAFRQAMEDSLVIGLRARDLHGRITYVNPAFCAMVGFSALELVGQHQVPPYWPPELAQDYAERQRVRAQARQLPPREGYESVFMHKNGSRFQVMIFEAPLINADGLHAGWMGSFLNVSEQRRAEELSRTTQERLQATARLAMVGEMASLLSHELNQPLAAIASYAHGCVNLLTAPSAATSPTDTAIPTAQDLADVRQATERIAQQAERAGRVIKSVHDFVRRREQVHERFAVEELLEAVLPIIRMQARKLEVQVELHITPGLPQLRGDRTMVEQVLLNLTRNAMQSMDSPDIDPSQRRLQLSIQASPAAAGRPAPGAKIWLAFAVSDCGSGISAEVAARLFTPFFTTRSEGMGLGLSLCRTVVEQHGGALHYAANLPRGTVFRFTLPAVE